MKYKIEIDPRSRWYYFNSKLHREDGPAVEWPAESIKWWFIDNKQFTETQFNARKTWVGFNVRKT